MPTSYTTSWDVTVVESQDGEVQAFQSGLLVGKVTASADGAAEAGVHALDRVGIPYERRRMLPVTHDGLDAHWRPGW